MPNLRENLIANKSTNEYIMGWSSLLTYSLTFMFSVFASSHLHFFDSPFINLRSQNNTEAIVEHKQWPFSPKLKRQKKGCSHGNTCSQIYTQYNIT